MPHRNDTELRRLYLYSEEDQLVYYKDLEQHAADAKKAGYSVWLEKFDGTPHVAHARKYPERYWKMVRDFWQGDLPM